MATLKRNPSGDWILRFWTRGHRLGSQLLYENFGQVTHAEALKRKAVLEAKWRTMRTHADPGLTFSKLAAKYLEIEGPRLMPRGLVLVEMILRCHLDPFFGEMKVEDMRALDVDSYRTQRRSLVHRKGSAVTERTDRPIAGATFNREWSLLRTILNWGESKELIEKNPVRRGAVKMREAKPRAVFFEPDEWATFLETMAQHEHFYRLVPFFRFMLLTASRPAEVAGLRWGDVDLERHSLTIRQKKVHGRPKVLWIVPELEALLKALPRGIGEAPVFVGRKGGAMPLTYASAAFSAARDRAGLVGQHGRLIPYAIRHTAATWLRRAGVSLDVIGDVLGHRAMAMKITLDYIHSDAQDTRPALEALAEAEKNVRERNGNEIALIRPQISRK
jgi:integrase